MHKPPEQLKPIDQYQDKDPVLRYFRYKLLEQHSLLCSIRAALPGDIGDYLQHAVLSQNEVILFTQLASYATPLRFYSNLILEALKHQAEYANVKKITVQLLPPTINIPPPPSNLVVPSTNTIQHLLINNSDDPLQKALNKLGKTLVKIQASKVASEL